LDEARIATDGGHYTQPEFIEHYGGTEEWDAAAAVTQGAIRGRQLSTQFRHDQAEARPGVGYADEWSTDAAATDGPGKASPPPKASPPAKRATSEERGAPDGMHDTKGQFVEHGGGTAEWEAGNLPQPDAGVDPLHKDHYASHTWHAGPLGIKVVPHHRDPTAPNAHLESDGVVLIDHPDDEGWNHEIQAGMLVDEVNGQDAAQWSYEKFIAAVKGAGFPLTMRFYTHIIDLDEHLTPDEYDEHTWEEQGPLGIKLVPAAHNPGRPEAADEPYGVILLEAPEWGAAGFPEHVTAGMQVAAVNGEDSMTWSYNEFMEYVRGCGRPLTMLFHLHQHDLEWHMSEKEGPPPPAQMQALKRGIRQASPKGQLKKPAPEEVEVQQQQQREEAELIFRKETDRSREMEQKIQQEEARLQDIKKQCAEEEARLRDMQQKIVRAAEEAGRQRAGEAMSPVAMPTEARHVAQAAHTAAAAMAAMEDSSEGD